MAKEFTREDVGSYLSLEEDSPYYLVRKCALAVSVSGALRSCELRSVQIEDLVKRGNTYHVKIMRSKQRGEKVSTLHYLPLLPPLTDYFFVSEYDFPAVLIGFFFAILGGVSLYYTRRVCHTC